MVAQQDGASADALALSDLLDALVLEERAAGAAKGAVGHDVDALVLAELDDIVLGQGWVVLDLVDSGHDLGLGEELLEIDLGVIGHANSLSLARLDERLHLLPGGDVVVVPGHVALAVGQLGEAVVVAVRVHADGPVDEEQVDVLESEALERLVEPELDASAVCVPQLGDDENILALDVAGVDGVLDALADLVLVTVAVGSVDQPVPDLERVSDGVGDLTGAGLPGACVKGRFRVSNKYSSGHGHAGLGTKLQ